MYKRQVLTQSIAVDWAKYGIRANIIIPGQFDTDMGAPLMNDPAALEAYVKRIPASRVGQPEELPSLVIYLCSDASSYVTGGLSQWTEDSPYNSSKGKLLRKFIEWKKNSI